MRLLPFLPFTFSYPVPDNFVLLASSILLLFLSFSFFFLFNLIFFFFARA
jgi:hypothetical protein